MTDDTSAAPTTAAPTTTATGRIATLSTPDGPFTVLEDEAGHVLASGWTAEPAEVLARIADRHRPAVVVPLAVSSAPAVEAYYDGDVEAVLRVPVRQFGTALFTEGWRQLRRVRAGDVLTYTQLAAAMGRPDAVRAAASVCARNAPALFVPCHRVLRSDGTLSGFAWGVDVKRSLLEREATAAAEGH
jgi:methylated-DNA-[protein]-cysteine S-methyltransferase